MHDVLTDGVIRKLWIERAGPYRDHLLRLDKESRRNRFGGGVSDEFILRYIDLSLGLLAPLLGLVGNVAGLGAVFLITALVALCAVPIAVRLQSAKS